LVLNERSRRITGNLIAGVAAIGAPILLTVLLLVLRGGVSRNFAFLFLIVVALIALLGPFWSGLVAAALSFLLMDYFFIAPRHQLTIADSEDVLDLALFFGTAILIGLLEWRRSRARLAAESLSRQLQLANADLIRLNREEAMAAQAAIRLARTEQQVVTLRESDRYRRELLANVSHDLKTPLTIIKFYGELLRDVSGGDPEKCAAHCEKIIEESDRLTEMVSELLETSKLEQSRGIALMPLRLDCLLRETAERFSALREREGFQFELAIEDGVTVSGQKDLLERAVYNLLANAAGFAGEDRRVWLRLYTYEMSGAKIARVEVADAGQGIPPEELPHIWERYYKSSRPHRRGVTGSGLGLAIVKTALQLHGARFGAESEMGRGSCFWFEMGAQ